MADTYRCINAFAFGDRMYPGGSQVEEGDPILASHGAHFARVASQAVVEATTAEPGARRDLTPPKTAVTKKAPAKKIAPSSPAPSPEKTSEDNDA